MDECKPLPITRPLLLAPSPAAACIHRRRRRRRYSAGCRGGANAQEEVDAAAGPSCQARASLARSGATATANANTTTATAHAARAVRTPAAAAAEHLRRSNAVVVVNVVVAGAVIVPRRVPPPASGHDVNFLGVVDERLKGNNTPVLLPQLLRQLPSPGPPRALAARNVARSLRYIVVVLGLGDAVLAVMSGHRRRRGRRPCRSLYLFVQPILALPSSYIFLQVSRGGEALDAGALALRRSPRRAALRR